VPAWDQIPFAAIFANMSRADKNLRRFVFRVTIYAHYSPQGGEATNNVDSKTQSIKQTNKQAYNLIIILLISTHKRQELVEKKK